MHFNNIKINQYLTPNNAESHNEWRLPVLKPETISQNRKMVNFSFFSAYFETQTVDVCYLGNWKTL